MTTASRNRVKNIQLPAQSQNSRTKSAFWSFRAQSTFPPLWFSLLGGMKTENKSSNAYLVLSYLISTVKMIGSKDVPQLVKEKE